MSIGISKSKDSLLDQSVDAVFDADLEALYYPYGRDEADVVVCAIDLEGNTTDNRELNNIDVVEQSPDGVFFDENLTNCVTT